MEVKLLKAYLKQIEREHPDSEIVIDIGRKDIFYWEQKEFENLGIDIAVGHTFIPPGLEFPNGKIFVYIVPETIIMV